MRPLLRILPNVPNFDFMGKRMLAFGISFLLIAGSFALLATRGLNYGIDFAGGTVIEMASDQPIDVPAMRGILNDPAFGEVSLQRVGSDKEVMLRLQPAKSQKDIDQNQLVGKVKELIAAEYEGTIEYRKIDYVGPQVGEELVRNGFMAVLFSMAIIMMYLWFRFEWQFGLGGVIALVHDAIIAMGFYSLTQFEFNLTSVAALLTIVGYSINDSVVIYDRVRENLRKYKTMEMAKLLNLSLNETLSRTIMTVMTTLLALLALMLLGGDVLFGFSTVMFFGIVVGTFSSIYISAPVLLYLNLRRQSPAGEKAVTA